MRHRSVRGAVAGELAGGAMAKQPRNQRRSETSSPAHGWQPEAIAAWTLAAAIVLLPVLGGTNQPGPVALLHLLLIFSAGLWLWALRPSATKAATAKPTAHATGADIPLLLLVLLSLASLGWTVSPHATMVDVPRRAAMALLFLLAAQAVGGSRGWMMLVAGVSAAAVQCLLAGREYAASYVMGATTWRVFGTTLGPNVLATVLVTALPFGLALYVAAKRPWHLVLGTVVVLQCAVLQLTGSRGGWLAAVLAAAAWLLLCAKHLTKHQLARLAVVAALCVVAVPLTSLPLRTRVVGAGAEAQAGSNRFRVLTWLGTLDLIRHHPVVGTGAGTFEVAYPPYARAGFTRMAHNSYLQLAAELGLPGLALWLWATLGALIAGYRRRAAPPGDRQAALLWGAGAAAVIGSAAHNGVDYGWYVVGPAGLYWLAAALSAGQAAPSLLASAWRRWAVVGLALLSAGALPQGLAAVYASRADRLPPQDAYARAALYQQALRWDPGNPSYRFERALALVASMQGQLAMDELAASVREEPNRGIVRYRYAQALQAAGRNQEALREYLHAAELDRTATSPLIAAARLYETMHNQSEARKLYRRVVQMEHSPVATVKALEDYGDINYAEAHLSLARMAEASGNRAAAAREAQAGLAAAADALRGFQRWRSVQSAAGRYDPSKEARAHAIIRELSAILGRPRPAARSGNGQP